MPRLCLGLDFGTQSLKAVVIDIDSGDVVLDHNLDYRRDSRLSRFGLNEKHILETLNTGEAAQPPLMYLASLDAMFSDLKDKINLGDIVVINNSGQQHSHVYLNSNARTNFGQLRKSNFGSSNLEALLKDSFAWDRAPIWKTSDTSKEAGEIRDYVGGKEHMIFLSGSDSPLRFTGAVIRRVGKNTSDIYNNTDTIQLLGNFIPAVLTANPQAPADSSNACGTSLMNYMQRQWSPKLIEAVSRGIDGGSSGLEKKLPGLTSPYKIIGNIANYFVEKYGFISGCKIVAGSGDNPQSKVLFPENMLSIGTSIVDMTSTDGETFDTQGFANGMYDGVGRPFIFVCRTNGAGVWDMVRAHYGIKKEDYAPGEEALRHASLGSEKMFLWQPDNESLPPSKSFDIRRFGYDNGTLADDFNGIIESSLAAVYLHSKHFRKESPEPFYVVGGATESLEIMRTAAAIWKRPVIPVRRAGAALGAAVAGAYAYLTDFLSSRIAPDEISKRVLKGGEMIHPRPKDVAAYHASGGFLERFSREEARLTA